MRYRISVRLPKKVLTLQNISTNKEFLKSVDVSQSTGGGGGGGGWVGLVKCNGTTKRQSRKFYCVRIDILCTLTCQNHLSCSDEETV